MTWAERMRFLREQGDRERGIDRDGYITRLEVGKWSLEYIATLSEQLLRRILAGQHGPLTPEEREACELWLGMRMMGDAAVKTMREAADKVRKK